MDKKEIIAAMINIFESGSIKGDYTLTEVLPDGAGITYGRSCTTLNSGNLYKLLIKYLNKQKSSGITDYYPSAGIILGLMEEFKNKKQWLNTDQIVLSTLRFLGSDPIMQQAQDEFFDEVYFAPAEKIYRDLGFTLPLSLAVIYDSVVQGSFANVRQMFSEKPPINGGNEKKWIKDYLEARIKFLSTRANKIVHATVYRPKEFQKLIAANNWELNTPFVFRGIRIE